MLKKSILSIMLLMCLSYMSCNGDNGGSSSDGGPTDTSTMDKEAPSFTGLSSIKVNYPDSMMLLWSAAKDNVTPENEIAYLICMSDKEGGCKDSFIVKYTVTGILKYEVKGLEDGKTYYFVVRARDKAGNTDTNTVEKSAVFQREKDTVAPNFMGLSYATPDSPGSVKLMWPDASDNITPKEKITYSICMSDIQGECINNFKETYKTDAGKTSYTVKDLIPNKKYYFVVRAIDEDGNMDLNKEERTAIPANNKLFVRTYGDATYRGASSFVRLQDGFVLCGGGRIGDMLDSDMFITRLDIYGNVLWIKVFGGNKGDGCSSVAVASDGSIFVAGTTQSYSVYGDKDVLFLKLSPNGDLIFSKQIYTDKNDLGPQIDILSDGIILSGYTEQRDGKYDSFLMKFDFDGKLISSRLLHSDVDDYINRIKVVNDKIYAVGYTNPESNTNYDGFLAIIDKDLNIVEQRLIGDAGYEQLTAMTIDSDGNILLGGQTMTYGDEKGDIFIISIKPDMNGINFAKVYSIDKKESPVDLAVFKDKYVIVGNTVPPIGGDEDGVLIITDKNGNPALKKYYRGIRDDWFSRVITDEQYIYILGGTASMHNETPEVWFLKLKDDGTTGAECVLSFINELNLTDKDITPSIRNGSFVTDSTESISVKDITVNSTEVGAYVDYQCIAD